MIAAHHIWKEVLRQDGPICIECGKIAALVTGERIYPRRPDLHARHFYLCECGAYCGTHRGTTDAVGYPCGPETRRARMAAHAAFDSLWQRKIKRDGCSKKAARGAGYKWLAKQMGLPREQCHIGMMTAEQARRVVEICQGGRPKA